MKQKRWIYLMLVLTMAFTLTSCAGGRQGANDAAAAEEETEMAGDAMAENEIIVYTFDGEPVNLAADGQRVYIKAWASWCSICLAGMSELDELSSEDLDFKVVSVVSPDEYGEMSEEDFIEWWNGLEYEHIQVFFDRDAKLFDELGIRGFPTSAYYNSKGELMGTIVGHNDNERIKSNMLKIE